MECQKCKCDIALSAKFCQNCGSSLQFNNITKSKEDVSLEFLQNIFESLDYKVIEIYKDGASILFSHEIKNKIFAAIIKSKNISLICLQTSFNLKKPGWGSRAALHAAIGKANQSTVLYRCYTSDNMDVFHVASHILITENISSVDIASFIEEFANNIYMVIENTGIKNFA